MAQREAFRETFRDSFRDALEGMDIDDLQSGEQPRYGAATPRAALPQPPPDSPVTTAQLDALEARLSARVDSVHLAVQRHREVGDEALRGLTARLLTLVCAGFFGLVVVVLLLALLLRH